MRRYGAVVIGCSAGGLDILRLLLEPLPQGFPLPVIVASHISADGGGLLAQVLGACCALKVEEPEDKQPVLPGHIYVAPANYHLLVESDFTFALSVDQRVCCVRPSIDVLFAAASDVWGEQLVGVLLTGANDDGAMGMKNVRAAGGLTLVQDPTTAFADSMPLAAIAADSAHRIFAPEEIARVLSNLPLGISPS